MLSIQMTMFGRVCPCDLHMVSMYAGTNGKAVLLVPSALLLITGYMLVMEPSGNHRNTVFW